MRPGSQAVSRGRGFVTYSLQLLHCSNSTLATLAVLWLAGTHHNGAISFLTWDVDFEDQCQCFPLILIVLPGGFALNVTINCTVLRSQRWGWSFPRQVGTGSRRLPGVCPLPVGSGLVTLCACTLVGLTWPGGSLVTDNLR